MPAGKTVDDMVLGPKEDETTGLHEPG